MPNRILCAGIVRKLDQQDAAVAARNADILRHRVICVGSLRKGEGGSLLPIQGDGGARPLKVGLKNKPLHGFVQGVAGQTGNAEIAIWHSRLLRFPPISVHTPGLLKGKQRLVIDKGIAQITAQVIFSFVQIRGHAVAGPVSVDNLGPGAVFHQFDDLQRIPVFDCADNAGGFGRTASYVERLAVAGFYVPGLRGGCRRHQQRQNQGQERKRSFCHASFASNHIG